MSQHYAITQMHAFNKEYPNAKDCYKKMQSWHIAENKNKQVFFPMQRTLILDPALMLEYQATKNDMGERGMAIMRKLNALFLFGAWRNTLGIYKLDKDIATECMLKPVPADTPVNIFKNLPEWCVYVDLSEIPLGTYNQDKQENERLVGFWAIFDYLEFENKCYNTLNIILDTNNPKDIYFPFALPLDDDMTVEQAVKELQDTLALETDDVFENAKSLKYSTTNIRHALSFLLWLCVAEPDITYKQEPVTREKLTQPKFAKHKKTGTFIPPNEPFIYEIGARLGGEYRGYQEKLDKYNKENPEIDDDQDANKKRKSSKKRPHIRRGHWHGHWYGTGQAREFRVKWWPAKFINYTAK